jgi:hypothetical protein
VRLVLAALAMLAAPAAAQMSPPVPPANPPANCTAAEHRQFDFWIGDWRVFRTSNPAEMVGGSNVESAYNGCGLVENWQPFTLMTGGSLSSYDRSDRRWHQTWIDSGGARVEFTGGLEGSNMVLTGLWRGFSGPGKDALVRMTWSRLPKGAVRQQGEASRDGGATWSPSFDFTYQPKPKSENVR